MTKRFILPTIMVSCVGLGACLNALFAQNNPPSTWKTLEKSYAQANLELAQARLAQAKSQNVAVKGSVSQGTVDDLTAGVQLTQDRLKQLESNARNNNPYAPQIAAAEGALRALETDHAESVKSNGIEAGTVPEVELRREQAEVAVAKVRLAALKALSQQPPEVRVRWEIAQLQDQVRA